MLAGMRSLRIRWMLLFMLACLLPVTSVYCQQNERGEYDYMANQVIYISNFTHILVSYNLYYTGIAAEITAARIKQTPNFNRELSDVVRKRYEGGLTIGVSGEKVSTTAIVVDDVQVEVYTGERTLRIKIRILLRTGISESEEAKVKSIVLYMEEKAIGLFVNPSLIFTSLVNRTLVVDKSMWAEFGAVHPMLMYETGRYRAYMWLYMTTADIAYHLNEILVIRNPEKYNKIAEEFSLALDEAKRLFSQLSADEASKLREDVWEIEDRYMYSFSSLPKYVSELRKGLAREKRTAYGKYMLALVDAVLATVAGYQFIKLKRKE